MGLLHILAYAGGLAAFLFVTLSLASGLLWLAELIEEHSRYAKTVGMRAIYVVLGLHFILLFTDSLPFIPTAFSAFCHLVYLQNFSTSWPYISLTSPKFILSCILVVADHFTWFFHFAALAQEAKKYRGPKYRYGQNAKTAAEQNSAPPFGDVAAFFAICVWFVPLFLFLSLSANDNALPSFDATASSAPPTPGGTVDLSTPTPTPLGAGGSGSGSTRGAPDRTRTSLVKSILSPLLSLLPRLRSSSKRQKNEEGLIAPRPRTPVRGSPLHSPVAMPSVASNSYFPWGAEDTSTSTSNTSAGPSTPSHGQIHTYPQGLPDRLNAHTPPPPRRIQSEIYSKSPTLNPRGLATRNGKPFSGNEEVLDAPKRDAPDLSSRSVNVTPSSMLGVPGEEMRRRKAD